MQKMQSVVYYFVTNFLLFQKCEALQPLQATSVSCRALKRVKRRNLSDFYGNLFKIRDLMFSWNDGYRCASF